MAVHVQFGSISMMGQREGRWPIIELIVGPGPALAPVAETGFSHILTQYKVVGHFFGLSYLSLGVE